MFVAECLSCGRLILSDDYGGQLEPELFDKAEILYPETLLSHASIPELIRDTYENAKRIQELNYDAFVVSIRKCIELTCILHGIEKGTLAKKLEKLCSQLSLPKLLVEAANSIRLFGNKAAHEVDGIHPVNSQQIDDFFIVLMEYIYVLPSKLAWFQQMNKTSTGEKNGLITKDGRFVFQQGKYRGWKP
ncbi:MAG TPA: DUF4145 domain-containing protein [Balneolales bacterium]|nr:DUF4145 domain-containing protein [Balneolales bacterium]